MTKDAAPIRFPFDMNLILMERPVLGVKLLSLLCHLPSAIPIAGLALVSLEIVSKRVPPNLLNAVVAISVSFAQLTLELEPCSRFSALLPQS